MTNLKSKIIQTLALIVLIETTTAQGEEKAIEAVCNEWLTPSLKTFRSLKQEIEKMKVDPARTNAICQWYQNGVAQKIEKYQIAASRANPEIWEIYKEYRFIRTYYTDNCIKRGTHYEIYDKYSDDRYSMYCPHVGDALCSDKYIYNSDIALVVDDNFCMEYSTATKCMYRTSVDIDHPGVRAFVMGIDAALERLQWLQDSMDQVCALSSTPDEKVRSLKRAELILGNLTRQVRSFAVACVTGD